MFIINISIIITNQNLIRNEKEEIIFEIVPIQREKLNCG